MKLSYNGKLLQSSMSHYLFDMILFGLAYVLMVYLIIRLVKIRRWKGNGNRDDDEDGGIELWKDPDIDLPPGICLPDGGPGKKVKIEDTDDVLV